MSGCGRLCCKSRKSDDTENLARAEFWATPPLQYSVVPIRSCVAVFSDGDKVPHISPHETHQRS